MSFLTNYEIVSELHHTAITTVYAVRAKDNPDILAMKAFETEHLTEEEKATCFDQILNSIQVQKKVASLADSHWAAIRDFGRNDKVFYVTDQYTHSLQNVLEGKIKIHPNALYQIISSILAGLQELKTTCNRPHGNLKPTNVLVKRIPDKNEFKVVLTDPLADSLIQDHHWQNDLQFICQIIYQLITGQNIPDIPEWRIQKDEHWKYLGKLGEGWINTCNTLLTIASEKQAADIEDVLVKLPVKKTNKPLIYRILLGLGLLGLAGFCIWGYGWYKQRQIDNAPPDSMKWKTLMVTYYDPWGRHFTEEIQKRKKEPGFQQKWDSAGLNYILKKETLEMLTYPAQVAEKANFVVSEYEQWKSAALDQKATSKETRNALEAYARITVLLNLSDKECWKYLTEIESQKKVFAAWQCETSLQQIVEGVNPQKPDCISNINRVLDIYPPLMECVKADHDLPETMEPSLSAALNNKIAGTLKDNFTAGAMDEVCRTLLKPLKETLVVANEALQEKENQEASRKILYDLAANLETDGAKAVRQATAELEELIITWDKLEKRIADSKPDGQLALQLWGQWKNKFEQYKTQKEISRDWLKTVKVSYGDFLSHIVSFQKSIDNPDNISLVGAAPKWQDLYSTLKTARQDSTGEDIRKAIESNLLGSADIAKKKGAEFADYLTDLKGRFRILGDIETALANYYLPEERIAPDSSQSIASLHNDFLKGNPAELLNAPDVKKLLDDIAAFDRLKQMNSPQEFFTLLTSSPNNLKPVYRYAAWKQLGQLGENWPWKDKQDMLTVYDALKKEAETGIAQDQRKQVIITAIDTAAAGQLKKYHSGQSVALDKTVDALKESDEQFSSLILEPFKEDIKNKLKSFNDSFESEQDVLALNTQLDTKWKAIDDEARQSIDKIALLINSTQWNDPKCRKDLFSREMKADWETVRQWDPAFFEKWTDNIALYHQFPDPRDTIVAKDISSRIDTEAEPAEKDGIRKEMDALIADIGASQSRNPAIQKNFNLISDAEKKFRERYNTIDQKLTPKWCGFLTWDDTNKKIVFKAGLLPDFEPVTLSEGTDNDLLSKKKWEAVNNPINWRELRKHQDPFFSPEGFDENKPSWPKYIRSVKDPTIICRFIPADGSKEIKPFYIGIQEVTFRQVTERRKYYQRKPADPPRWTGYSSISEEKLDFPFVYITAENAGKCAQLLGGRIPTSAEHQYVRDWVNGDEISFHLTAAATLDKVIKTYNYYASNKEATTSGQFWEVGVIRVNDKNNETNVAVYQKCFPRKCSKSDPKGLYDIEGNVWEWCDDQNGSMVICGYSSLTPKEFRTAKIHYSLKGRDSDNEYNWDVNPQNIYCDVGFRIAVDIPNTQ